MKEHVLKLFIETSSYQEWIERFYPDKESKKNQCRKAVYEMSFFFQELQIQVGTVKDANGKSYYHCWLLHNVLGIIDPTIEQFEGPVEYYKIADRFLEKDEIDLSTGAIFLKEEQFEETLEVPVEYRILRIERGNQ